MRCLIVQNRLGLDGRSRCVVEFVRVLNELGIEPHLLCLRSADPDIGRPFGLRDLRYTMSQAVPWPLALGAFFPEVLLTNLLARRVILDSGPDLVFNSNCIWAFLPAGPRYIHYIHFTFRGSVRLYPRFRSGFWKLYGGALRVVMPEGSPPPRSRFIANSELARAALCQDYALDATVVYPPSWSGEVRPCRAHLRRVVTLGSFHPDKRQLEQIELAGRLPDWSFTILGSRVSPGYAAKVQRAARRTPNVNVVVDASRQRIADELTRASHFVHTNRAEAFGIAVAEAAAAGCVPVVPDSGGVREIVEPAALRFTTVAGCADVLRRTAGEDGCALLRLVQERLDRFTDVAFRSALRDVVLDASAQSVPLRARC